jgi:hypothetical protein
LKTKITYDDSLYNIYFGYCNFNLFNFSYFSRSGVVGGSPDSRDSSRKTEFGSPLRLRQLVQRKLSRCIGFLSKGLLYLNQVLAIDDSVLMELLAVDLHNKVFFLHSNYAN